MRRRAFAAAGLAAAALGLCAACASSSAAPGRPGQSIAGQGPALLSSAALPGLAQATHSLPAAELAKDASVPGITSALVADGYLGGSERTFQGPSRHLTFVASRSLVFRDGTGAGDFLAFVRAHADAWFGASTQGSAVLSARRPGFVFQPAECACHLANPVLVGVVQDGPRLAWLEINGPDASRGLLLDLMTPARSTASG